MGDGESDYIGHGIDKVESADKSIRPDFLSHNTDSDTAPDSSADNENYGSSNSSFERLGNSEKKPQNPLSKSEAGNEAKDLRNGEENQKSDKDYKGNWANLTGKAKENKLGGPAKKKGLLKLAKILGPAGTVIIMLIMGIVMSFFSQSAMLAHVVETLQGYMDPTDIISSIRSRVLVRDIMSGNNTKGGLWSKFSDLMEKEFKKSNVEVVSNSETTSLKYENSAGKITEVNGNNLEKVYETDNIFHKEYTDGTILYNNSTEQFYDPQFTDVEGKYKINRNTDSDVEISSDPAKTKENFLNDATNELNDATGTMGTQVSTADGVKQTTNNVGDVTSETVTSGQVSAKIDSDEAAEGVVRETVEEGMGGMDFNLVGQIANGVCQLYNIASSLHRMVKAYEVMQVAAMAMKTLESIQRMQSGDGDDAIANTVGDNLIRERTVSLKLSNDEEVTVSGSVMTSAPMASLLGGSRLSDNDPTVKSFTTSQNQFMKIMDVIDGGTGYRACVGVQLAASVLSLVGDITTGGIIRIAGLLASIVGNIVIEKVVSAVSAIMVPKIVGALKRDFSSFVTGPQASAVLVWGSEVVMNENAKRSGMQPANPKTLAAYVKAKQEVIADRARYDRNNLSPFDASSQYTFMGSLLRSFGMLNLKTASIVGKLGSAVSMAGKSLIALTPAAHASDISTEIYSQADVPEITDLNGDNKIATAFGTPKMVADLSTAGENVEDVMYELYKMGVFEDYDPVKNPNPPIRTDNDNEGYKFVTEYIMREAELGYPDSEIESRYVASTGSGTADAAISALPVIGSMFNILQDAGRARNVERILGSYYTADTRKNHLFERYAQDQRLGVAMGMYDRSQISVVIENYRKEHPLDNSTLGIIARRSGLTKEEVKKDIAMINGLLFVADYNPDGLGPLVVVEEEIEIVFESSDYYHVIGLVGNSLVVEDKKNQCVTA